MSNPLLEDIDHPSFSTIQAEHVEPAIEHCIKNCKTVIETLSQRTSEPTWDNLVNPIEAVEDKLNKAWSPVSHLNSVKNEPALREAYEACLPKLSQYASEVGQNYALFKAYTQLSESPDFRRLSKGQRKVIKDALLDFKLAGVNLDEAKKNRFKSIQEELSRLSSEYSNNVLDCSDAWQYHTENEAELAGLPDHVIEKAAHQAKTANKQGFLFGLDAPTYQAVLMHADSETLRETFYCAYSTKAATSGPHDKKWDNSSIMEQTLALRHEKANILEFNNYAELSLAKKMANSTEQVESFLEGLADCALPHAKKELKGLTEFAGRPLNSWDLAYYSEKLKEKNFGISQEELRPYFPINKVLHGMFALTEKLFGVTLKEKTDLSIWHEEVQYFEASVKDEDVCGGFYLDLFARKNKRGGAWMDECQIRRKDGDKLQLPIAFLTCNFTSPSPGQPALLTHDEVETLFHEFGHTLHHILTKVDHAAISGINGVAWDAVELPSQFLENFCWQKDVMPMISGHHETSEPLPEAMFDKLKAGKTFQAGMAMLRQIEFALFDFRLHKYYTPNSPTPIAEVLDAVRKEVSLVIPPEYNCFQNSFSHIFAGGYAAGYYSYKWAEVLSSDAFARFEEDGLFNADTGHSFLTNILQQGGSQDPLSLFVKFRSREPDISALLRHNGLH